MRMKTKFLLGVASTTLSVALMSHGGFAASIDDVMQRLDALEKSNSRLEKENSTLRERVRHIEGAKAPAPASAPAAGGTVKSNPVVHGAVAASPAPKAGGGLSVGGMHVKAGPLGPLIDNTTVTLYGHVDVSYDVFNNSVFDHGTKSGIAANLSYFGIRARHNLAPYGYAGLAVLAQFESQVDVAAFPNERAAFGTRDSFVGLESPWGTIKAGKSDTPYKKSTAPFDPFSGTLGDYNSIMGNTGGDNRAEFDWRMPHAIWYESPIVHGFQFSALFSPGQNLGTNNNNFAYGDAFQCNGASTRGSGSNFPNTGGSLAGNIGGNACTDGSYGNAYSASLTFKNGPFSAIAAYEMHEGVNRHGDDGLEPALAGTLFSAPVFLPDGSQVITGVHNEWAAKVGAGLRGKNPLGDVQFYAMYEWLRRDGAPAAFNERSRDGVFASATQFVGPWSFSASYAHAFRTPGDPATFSPNNITAYPAALGGTSAVLQGNLFDNSASQYALGAKYRFSEWATWYIVGSEIVQGRAAHYCLGASGHGYQVCSRDQLNDVIGGATIKAVTTGLTLDF